MKQFTPLIFVVGLAACVAARAQTGIEGPAVSGPTNLPYPPRQPAVPVGPQADSRPAGWPGGVARVQPRQLSEEEALSPWLKPSGGIPDQFDGTEVVARIGPEVVLASELLPGVEETIARAIKAGQVQESQETALRHHLMRQRLQSILENKMLLIEARREIPKENMDKIRKKIKEIYDREQIPKLIDGTKYKSRADLIKAMHDAGTSLEDQEQQFFERSLTAQYVHKKFGEEKDPTHEEMLAYYREHLKDYETPPRARWEHIMVNAANYAGKPEAYGKIAEWGNEVFRGVPFSEVAKRHSDDFSSEDGGMHDWTSQGSLASDVLNQAIFSLPIGQLSPILEDERGFHIVRVVERQDLTRKPFPELQAEIKKKIKSDREGVALKKYLAELHKRVPVWTIFDDLPAPEKAAD